MKYKGGAEETNSIIGHYEIQVRFSNVLNREWVCISLQSEQNVPSISLLFKNHSNENPKNNNPFSSYHLAFMFDKLHKAIYRKANMQKIFRIIL